MQKLENQISDQRNQNWNIESFSRFNISSWLSDLREHTPQWNKEQLMKYKA